MLFYDLARTHVRETYLRPALQKGEHTISVNVGAVHKALGFTNRVPLVCAALKSKRFLEENGLRIIGQTGPPSGQSTTVTFTYELLDRNTKEGESIDALSGIRGIAKELFRKLGGGDSFVRKERSNFHG
jgi:hypothetical protein